MEFHFSFPDHFFVTVDSKAKKFRDALIVNDKRLMHDRLFSILQRSHGDFYALCSAHGIFISTCNACKSRYARCRIDFELTVHGETCFVTFKDEVEYPNSMKYCFSGRTSDCPASKVNPNSASFYSMTMGISHEAALSFLRSKNKSPFYRENHASPEEYSNFQRRDLASYKQRYGEIDGVRKYEEVCQTISRALSPDELIKRHGEEFYESYLRRKDSASLQFYLDKYGEDGHRLREERIKKCSNNLEGFVMRHGAAGVEKYQQHVEKRKLIMTEQHYVEKHGAKGSEKWKKICQSYSVSLEKFIKKYGQEEGRKKYVKWLSRTRAKRHYSAESLDFMRPLLEKYDCKYAEKELYLWDSIQNRIFFYDFYFPHRRLVVEYDTPFCHPNPDYMTPEEFEMWQNPFIPMNAHAKYELDLAKAELASSKGYNFHRCYISSLFDKEEELRKIERLLS